ncbi:calcium/sodium antiporter [Halococcus saccharolyticus]|uniref:Na+/Ca+ antiporter n=1 Tax=Halococcus saccharolyticus DSM 5350 TaxID=1227455 RepID=M0MGZ4_9EURY|nr:calcium/sodium antiporter [Halococcus saccharolyticus]EMA43695.1 Na+/Ca+ antiporter [Halococcus saccharolyticus DSM 5350]
MVGSVVVDVGLIAVAVVGLWLGATLFVEHAARLARRVGLSDLVVGLVVVSLGTSAPEFAVTIDAALVGSSDVAAANVVGSNLFNLAILGGVALVAGASVRVPRALVRRDAPVMTAATALVGLFLFDLRVSRPEALLLLVVFLAYLAVLLRSETSANADVPTAPARWFSPLLALVGLGVIVGGATMLVSSASDLARLLGASEWLIGLTVVAVGTSAPEIAASVVAARRGLATVAVGNVLGSNVFNLLGVLGAAATIQPLDVDPAALGDVAWLFALSVAAAVTLRSGRRLTRIEGVAVLVAVAVRWVLDAL